MISSGATNPNGDPDTALQDWPTSGGAETAHRQLHRPGDIGPAVRPNLMVIASPPQPAHCRRCRDKGSVSVTTASHCPAGSARLRGNQGDSGAVLAASH